MGARPTCPVLLIHGSDALLPCHVSSLLHSPHSPCIPQTPAYSLPSRTPGQWVWWRCHSTRRHCNRYNRRHYPSVDCGHVLLQHVVLHTSAPAYTTDRLADSLYDLILSCVFQVPTLPPPPDTAYLSNMVVDAKVRGGEVKWGPPLLGQACTSLHQQA
jgi:hypothetical protein